MYNNSTNDAGKVNFYMFRRVFVNDFNIGFKSPASDVCTHCSLFDEKRKKTLPSSPERIDMVSEKRNHKKFASAFYEEIRM
jgi:hypothetical protein